MALDSRQRYLMFFIGLSLGCVVAVVFFQIHGVPQPPEPPPPGVIRRQVPSIVLQWMAEGKPIEGKFILSFHDARHDTGASADRFSRYLVVLGLDPGAYIRIEEISSIKDPDRVTEWKFMFADHVRAQLQPTADTRALSAELAKLGWRFDGGKDKDGWVTIVLKDHEAQSIEHAESQLKEWPQWTVKTAPDYLPIPAPTSANGPV